MKQKIINLSEGTFVNKQSQEFEDNIYFQEIGDFLRKANESEKEKMRTLLREEKFESFQRLVRGKIYEVEKST